MVGTRGVQQYVVFFTRMSGTKRVSWGRGSLVEWRLDSGKNDRIEGSSAKDESACAKTCRSGLHLPVPVSAFSPLHRRHQTRPPIPRSWQDHFFSSIDRAFHGPTLRAAHTTTTTLTHHLAVPCSRWKANSKRMLYIAHTTQMREIYRFHTELQARKRWRHAVNPSRRISTEDNHRSGEGGSRGSGVGMRRGVIDLWARIDPSWGCAARVEGSCAPNQATEVAVPLVH